MRRKIIKIQEAITEGDTYQVNYTTRLSSKSTLSYFNVIYLFNSQQ